MTCFWTVLFDCWMLFYCWMAHTVFWPLLLCPICFIICTRSSLCLFRRQYVWWNARQIALMLWDQYSLVWGGSPEEMRRSLLSPQIMRKWLIGFMSFHHFVMGSEWPHSEWQELTLHLIKLVLFNRTALYEPLRLSVCLSVNPPPIGQTSLKDKQTFIVLA